MYILVWPQRVLTWFWLYLGGGVGYCPSRPNHFCLMCIAHSLHRFARPMRSDVLAYAYRRKPTHSPSSLTIKCMASVFLDKRTLDHIKQILVKEDPAITCQKTLRPSWKHQGLGGERSRIRRGGTQQQLPTTPDTAD